MIQLDVVEKKKKKKSDRDVIIMRMRDGFKNGHNIIINFLKPLYTTTSNNTYLKNKICKNLIEFITGCPKLSRLYKLKEIELILINMIFHQSHKPKFKSLTEWRKHKHIDISRFHNLFCEYVQNFKI